MNSKQILLAALSALVIQGCANSGGSSGGSGTQAADTSNNYKSGNCGSNVVSEYNTVAIRCGSISQTSSKETLKNCKSTAQSFVDKYPDINCTAVELSSSSVNKEPIQIDKTEIDAFKALIQLLTSAGI